MGDLVIAASASPGNSTQAPTHAASHGGTVILWIGVCMLVGNVVRDVSKTRVLKTLAIPYTVWLLLIGMMAGALVYELSPASLKDLGTATDTLQGMSPDLFLEIFMPALIFESAFAVNFHIIFREFAQATLLAVPGVIIAALFTSVLCQYIWPYNWDFATAWMVGSIVSATDPVAVVALLRELGASKRLSTLIEAESLLNDGSAFVMYVILREFVIGNSLSAGEVVWESVRLSFGGLLLGIIAGALVVLWLRRVFDDPYIETTMTIAGAYVVFYVAENGLSVSGILTLVFFGLTLAKYKASISVHSEEAVEHVWEMISYMANTILFVLSGVIVCHRMFYRDGSSIGWNDVGHLLLLYVWIHLARALSIAMLYPFLKRTGYGMTRQEATVLLFGGLRGAIGLALALLTDLEKDIALETRDRIVFHVAGIVLLTLTLNGSLIRHLVHYLGMDQQTVTQQVIFHQAIEHLRHKAGVLITSLKQDKHYAGAEWSKVRRLLPRYKRLEQGPFLNRKLQSNTHAQESGAQEQQPTTLVHLEPAVEMTTAGGRNKKKSRRGSLTLKQKLARGLSFLESSSNLSETAKEARLVEIERQESEVNHQQFEQLLQEYFEDDEGLRREIRHRFLSSMKATYWQQFHEGQIRRSVLDYLVEACESALDCGKLEVQFHIIQDHFRVPNWLHRFYSSNFLPDISRKLLYNRLSLGVELATAFILASEKLEDLQREFPEFAGMTVVSDVRDEAKQYETEAKQVWMDVQMAYPDVYRAIQTGQAAQFILHFDRKSIESLLHDGIIEEAEFLRMTQFVDRHIHELQEHPLTVSSAADSHRLVLQEISFLQHLSAQDRKRVLNSAARRLYPKGEYIYNVGELCTGIYVVTRGMVSILVDDNQVDAVSVGSVVGSYTMLSGQPFLASSRASTLVELYFIHSSVLFDLMDSNLRVEDDLWRLAGSGVVKVFFQNAFPDLDRIQIGKMCAEAEVLHAKDELLEIKTQALLITGEAIPTGAGPDSLISAPAMFLPSPIAYRMSEGSRILMFDVSKVANTVSSIFRRANARTRSVEDLQPHVSESRLSTLSLPLAMARRGSVSARYTRIYQDDSEEEENPLTRYNSSPQFILSNKLENQRTLAERQGLANQYVPSVSNPNSPIVMQKRQLSELNEGDEDEERSDSQSLRRFESMPTFGTRAHPQRRHSAHSKHMSPIMSRSPSVSVSVSATSQSESQSDSRSESSERDHSGHESVSIHISEHSDDDGH